MHHDWAVGVANELSEPALACEAVLAETAFKLRSVEVVLEMIVSELVKVSFDRNDHLPQLTDLAKGYADRQPDLADLCLIRLGGLYPHPCGISPDKVFRVSARSKRALIPLT